MFNKARKLYARFLFRKYGFERGLFFEKIPLVYRVCPLFSPSLYAIEEGRQISEWFMEGMSEGAKMEGVHERQ